MSIEISNRKLDSYSFEDYSHFEPNFKCEIIWGKVVMMSPAPSFIHQDTIGKLFIELTNKIPPKCKVILSPIDVLLDFNEDFRQCKNIVQPDIVVLCNQDKITNKGIIGSPDLVIEIVSPSSLHNDTISKYNLYEKFGVQEYWIVFPEMRTIVINTLENDSYISETYNYNDIIIEAKSKVFDALKINMEVVFE